MSGKKPPRPLAPSRHPTVPRPRQGATTARSPQDAPPNPPLPAYGPTTDRPMAPMLAAGVAVLLAVVTLVVMLLRAGGPDTVAKEERGTASEPPVDLKAGTSYVDSRVTSKGDLEVRQWIRSTSDLFGVGLTVPVPVAGADTTPVRVEDIRVVADGRDVIGADRLRSNRGFYAFGGADEVFVSYRMSGAVDLSDTQPGRALARFTALDVETDPPLTATTYAVSGGKVLSLACASDEADAVPVPCGGPTDDGWMVERRPADNAGPVIAQLDLP